MIQKLKIKREYADAVATGVKTFEVRKNDRNYQVGDIVVFQILDDENGECFYHPLKDMAFLVPYILCHDDFPDGVPDGYCVLTLSRMNDEMANYFVNNHWWE